MAASMGIGFVMMLMVGNGGGELLDMIDTKAYWAQQGQTPSVELMTSYISKEDVTTGAGQIDKLIAQLGAAAFEDRENASAKLIAIGADARPALTKAKQSDDPEIALRAEEILDKISGKDKPANVRKLMAIRALGELGDKAAFPALQKLLKSEEPFVAEYAQRAINQLEGKKRVLKRVPDAVMAKDLALLPAEVGMVMQVNAQAGAMVTLDELLQQGMLPPGTDASGIKQQMAEELTKVAATTGNFRIEAATIGLGPKADDQDFYGILILRGKCDRAALIAAMRREGPFRGSDEYKGFTVHHMHDAAIIEISNEQLIFVVAENPEKPVKLMVEAIKAGKGGVMTNKAMVELIKKNKAKPHDAWMAVVMNPTYRQAAILAPFDTIRVVADRTREGGMALKLNADGQDEVKTAAAIKEFIQGRDWAVQQMQPMAAMMPAMQKTVDALKAIKPKQDDGSVEIETKLDINAGAMSIMPMMMFGVRAMDVPAPAVEVQEARPVPVAR